MQCSYAMHRYFYIIILLTLLSACQKGNVIVLNEEENCFEIDPVEKIFWNKDKIQETNPKPSIAFQSNRVIINFANGSTMILSTYENSCNELECEKTMDSCLEEYLIAALCDEDNNNTTIFCSSDTSFWELNIQLAQRKEGIDTSQFKIKRFKKNSPPKALLEKMAQLNYLLSASY